MAINPDISLQVQTPNAMNTLGSILNVASTGQQIATQKIANESNQKTLNEQNNIRDLMQHPEQFQDQAGNWDWNKFTPALMKAAPTLGPDYIPKVYQGVQAHAAATNALQNMNAQQLTGFGEWLGAHQNDSPDAINAQVDWMAKANPVMAPMADAVKHLMVTAGNDPNARKKAIGGLLQGVQTSAEQRAMQTPNYVGTGTDQLQLNPQATQNPSAIPGAMSPAQEVIDPATGAKRMIGSQSPSPVLTGQIPGTTAPGFGGDPKAIANQIINDPKIPDADKWAALAQLNAQVQGQSKPNLQTSLPIGQEKLAGGNADIVNNHYTSLAFDAANSGKMEGIARNIQDLAPKAITGTGEEKLSFMNGLLAQMKQPAANDLKTATDLLQKNMAMLTQNTPAGSDAARLINQFAQPHATMSPEAMKDAAGQIIGQIKMSRDAFDYFSPDQQVARKTGDTSAYMQKLSQFNQVADPRIWQFEDMPKPEQKAFVQRMPPQEQQQFRAKLQSLMKMGFFK